jgi:hypothetical protein
VRRFAVLLAILCLSPVASAAQDPLGEARRLYNAGSFDEAAQAARAAMEQPGTANSARVVLGRIHLERYRRAPSSETLAEARTALREVDASRLESRERLELTMGFAETFLEDRFAAAAEMFGPILASSDALGDAAHDRVLDWWASALDRHAQTRPMAERPAIYAKVAERMQRELERDPGSVPAGYWVVASARASGDLDSAWNAATAAWIRATLGRDRGVILRGDLDRGRPGHHSGTRRAALPERLLGSPDPGLAGCAEATPRTTACPSALRALRLFQFFADAHGLEQQLVVHGEDHPRPPAGARSAAAPACTSIIARFRMSAAVPWIGMFTATRSAAARGSGRCGCELRHEPAPAEQRLDDARLARLGRASVDEAAHAGKPAK